MSQNPLSSSTPSQSAVPLFMIQAGPWAMLRDIYCTAHILVKAQQAVYKALRPNDPEDDAAKAERQAVIETSATYLNLKSALQTASKPHRLQTYAAPEYPTRLDANRLLTRDMSKAVVRVPYPVMGGQLVVAEKLFAHHKAFMVSAAQHGLLAGLPEDEQRLYAGPRLSFELNRVAVRASEYQDLLTRYPQVARLRSKIAPASDVSSSGTGFVSSTHAPTL